MEEPVNHEIARESDGRFVKGQSANPAGRPKGLNIKEEVRKYLEDHPEDQKKFIEYFAKKDRALAWKMLEGMPSQQTDITTKGKELPGIINVVAPHEGD